MVNPHTPESFDRVILGLGIMVVGPALIPAPIMTTLTATPLRQVGAVILGGVLLAVYLYWVVSFVRIRASAAVERGES